MEACCGAHHLARLLLARPHGAWLMPPKSVQPFIKRGNSRSAGGGIDRHPIASMAFGIRYGRRRARSWSKQDLLGCGRGARRRQQQKPRPPPWHRAPPATPRLSQAAGPRRLSATERSPRKQSDLTRSSAGFGQAHPKSGKSGPPDSARTGGNTRMSGSPCILLPPVPGSPPANSWSRRARCGTYSG